ncbi:protein lifeguard 1 [Elysia marginata]|uniref:Protein lifeguard 1 n=1 Tax=Elysia marginata TaxID=1093978 RepID=A0AAV4GSX4_9GAST|nr:protein lifeguard 1 [Elysia marginata]
MTKVIKGDNQVVIVVVVVVAVVVVVLHSVGPWRTPEGSWTVCEGFLLGTVSSHYDRDEVLMAMGITAIVTVALTIFAFQTKWDFTMMGGILFVAVIVLFCFGLLCLFIQSRILSIVYASIGALIFSVYLVFDTQLMLGGKHKYALSPEEYIFAALNLYLDIINLFLFILSIIGNSRD